MIVVCRDMAWCLSFVSSQGVDLQRGGDAPGDPQRDSRFVNVREPFMTAPDSGLCRCRVWFYPAFDIDLHGLITSLTHRDVRTYSLSL
jgi:hypothetical protein